MLLCGSATHVLDGAAPRLLAHGEEVELVVLVPFGDGLQHKGTAKSHMGSGAETHP